jgi:hypothetical protein
VAGHQAYFGQPLPNSYYLKGTVPLADCVAGAKYMFHAVVDMPFLAIWAVALCGVCVLSGQIKMRIQDWFCLIVVGCGSAVAIRAGGDYMPHSRLFGWFLPIILVTCCQMLIRLAESANVGLHAVAAPLLGCLVAATGLAGYGTVRAMQVRRIDENENHLGRVAAGQAVDKHMQSARYKLGLGVIGGFGYGAKQAYIIDPLMLGSHKAISGAILDATGKAGHRWSNNAFVENAAPDVVVLRPGLSPASPEKFLEELRNYAENPEQVAALRSLATMALNAPYELKWIDLKAGRVYFFQRKE